MALQITHSFQSPKLDGPDPTVVRPSNWNANHTIAGTGFFVAGMVIDWLGHTTPADFLECYGQSVAAASYPTLFQNLVKSDTVTFTISSPGVVNWTSHGLVVNSKVKFRKNGVATFPTGITENVDYYIISAGFSASAFQISATAGGAAINFTGSQSGVFTGVNAQYGVSTDLLTFTVPDLRGRVTAGLDTMGGSAASRLTSPLNGAVLGNSGGAQTHTLVVSELATHQHNNHPPTAAGSATTVSVTVDNGGGFTPAGSISSNGGFTPTGTLSSNGEHTPAGSLSSDGAHTPAGSIGSEAAHTHSIDPPPTATSAAGAAAAHTHPIPVLSGTAQSDGLHTHPHTLYASSDGSHSHHFSGDTSDTTSGGGNLDRIVRLTNSDTGEQDKVTSTGGSHTHDLAGAISNSGSHTHTVSTGASNTNSGGSLLDHTHTVNISSFTSAAGSSHTHTWTGTAVPAHTHTFTGTAVPAHTHTFTGDAVSAHSHTFTGTPVSAHTHTASASGTVTSTMADFLSDAAGSDGAHNNLQPTFITRKLVYVG